MENLRLGITYIERKFFIIFKHSTQFKEFKIFKYIDSFLFAFVIYILFMHDSSE